MPIKNIHTPPMTLPPMNCRTPRKMRPRPKAVPMDGGDPGGPAQVALGAPQDGAQHPPAVQGEGRQEVKGRQDEVDVEEVIGDGIDRGSPAAGLSPAVDQVKYAPDGQAGQGADDGHHEFGPGGGGLIPHLRHPAEDEQGDALHGHAELPGHQGVAELMGHDGDEEPQGPHHPHGPVSHRGEVRIPGGKGPFGQGPGDQHRDDEPAEHRS